MPNKVCDYCEEPLDAQDELELLPNEKRTLTVPSGKKTQVYHQLCRSCKLSSSVSKDHVKGVIGYEDPDGVNTSTWLPY